MIRFVPKLRLRWLLLGCLMVLASQWSPVVAVGSQYPIPYDATPDWEGTVTGGSMRLPSFSVDPHLVLNHVVVAVRLLAPKPLKVEDAESRDLAARQAYESLFKDNIKHIGNGDCYIVMMIYGVPDAEGTMPQYAYVFTRNSNRWQPRSKITEAELSAIEAALGGTRF